jgi:hypothetical protein
MLICCICMFVCIDVNVGMIFCVHKHTHTQQTPTPNPHTHTHKNTNTRTHTKTQKHTQAAVTWKYAITPLLFQAEAMGTLNGLTVLDGAVDGCVRVFYVCFYVGVSGCWENEPPLHAVMCRNRAFCHPPKHTPIRHTHTLTHTYTQRELEYVTHSSTYIHTHIYTCITQGGRALRHALPPIPRCAGGEVGTIVCAFLI